jgi:hypothetical protein
MGPRPHCSSRVLGEDTQGCHPLSRTRDQGGVLMAGVRARAGLDWSDVNTYFREVSGVYQVRAMRVT